MSTDSESVGGGPRTDRQTTEERAERQWSVRDTRSPAWRRFRRGAEGGALATAVMTVYRLPVTRSLPPTAEFWARYVTGGDPDDHPVAALVLHLLYGVVAGTVFAAMFPFREPVSSDPGDHGPPSPAGEVSATVYGLLYGLVLSVVGERVILGAVLDIDSDDRFAFHVGHVLYGITLGAWIGTRTRDR